MLQALVFFASFAPAAEPDARTPFIGTWATSVEMDGKKAEVVMLLLTYLSPTGSDEPVQLRFRKRK
jgi:hypothetical protein